MILAKVNKTFLDNQKLIYQWNDWKKVSKY